MRHTSSSARLSVIGAGAWGTVLAILLARNGNSVSLWARRPELAEAIRNERVNRDRLPGVSLPVSVEVTANLSDATVGAAAAFVAVPSKGLAELAPELNDVPALVSCSKGLLPPGLTRLSQVLRKGSQERIAVLSGPNLANEIAAGLPAAAVAASHDPVLAADVQGWIQSTRLRVYTSPDPAGVEVGGGLKNVIALATGMSDGLGLGENAKASIVARGLVELVRVGLALGARRDTLYGLTGLGDLVATCSSPASRNRTTGERIATGASLKDLDSEGVTAEGVPTAQAAHEFACERGLELPITAEVYRVIFERKDPRRAIEDLMSRANRAEW